MQVLVVHVTYQVVHDWPASRYKNCSDVVGNRQMQVLLIGHSKLPNRFSADLFPLKATVSS
jgi:hypothetical protein